MPISRIFIADPGLSSDEGHHLATSLALAKAARDNDLPVTILASKRYAGGHPDVTPAFSQTMYEPPQLYWSKRAGNVRSGPPPTRNATDLLNLAERFAFGADDILFFHTVTVRYIASLFSYFLLVPPQEMPSIFFLLRFDPEFDRWAGAPEEFAEAVRRLKGLRLLDRKVFMCAETEMLADFHGKIADCSVSTIYHFSAFPHPAPQTPAPDKPIIVGYFGEGRAEKGFDAYHRAVERLVRTLPEDIVLLTQCYASGMNAKPQFEAARDFFGSDAYLGAGHKVYETLDDGAYGEALAQSDVLVVPHRAPPYLRRGSGVFVDGVVFDKIMVIRSGTWMGAFCPEANAVLFDRDEDLAEAISTAIERARERRLRPTPRNRRAAIFDVGANIRHLVGVHMGRRPAPAHAGLRVLHIAPIWLRQGSTRVFEAQLRMLAEIGAEVVCAHIADFSVDPRPDQSTYAWFFDQAPCENALHQWLVASPPERRAHEIAVSQALMGKSYSWLQEHMTAGTLEPPETLKAFVARGDIDLVVLNYAHNLPLVEALGLDGVPVIVETHDIRSHQFADLGGPEAAARDHVAEITALKRASGIVNINIREAETIAAEVGPKPTITVLPTLPIELDRTWLPRLLHGSPAERNAIYGALLQRIGAPEHDFSGFAEFYAALRHRHGANRVLCFLGSAHRWNMASLNWFYDKVFEPYLAAEGVKLVIAGRAGLEFTRLRGKLLGVIALGELLDPSLLYEAGLGFVLPVVGGTGFPIKTLEALVAGVPVVGTPEAFRSFPELQRQARVATTPEAFAEAALAMPTVAQNAAAGAKPLPTALTWEGYVRNWVRLIERVTGRPIEANAPPQRRRATMPLAVPKISPLALGSEGWRCDSTTQPDFLAASAGFAPSPSEKTFSWSNSGAVVIELAFEGTPSAVSIEVMSVAAPEGTKVPSQDVIVFDADACADRLPVIGGNQIVIPLDPSAEGRAAIEMVLPGAHYGLEFGGWRDMRRLGIAVSSIRLLS